MNKFLNPKKKLLCALDRIEKFTKKEGKKNLPNIFQKPGKIIKFAKYFIPAIFSRKARKRLEIESRQVEDEVFKAIVDVKRFHPIFCQKKDSEDYHLAKRAQNAIFDINKIIENNQKQASDWSKKVLTFMIKRKLIPFGQAYKISLPKTDFIPKKIKEVVDKKELAQSLKGRELDLFRMKAISHVQKHSVLFSSVQDILTSVRNNPIYLQKKGENPAFATLEQTFTPFPGETIIFRGSLENKTGSCLFSIPKDFDVSFVSKQTGFPYPIQHSGWALADPLVAKAPLQIERLPKLQALLQKKEEAALELSKRGGLIEKAKELLLFKRKPISEKSNEFLKQHKRLIFSILKASDLKDANIETKVNNFFRWLEKESMPYVAMAKIYQQFNDEKIVKPYLTLSRAWVDQSEKKLYSCNATDRLFAAGALLKNQKKFNSDYLNLLSKATDASFQNIMLQNFSEIIDYNPPDLSNFEMILQTSLYTQLELFLQELGGQKPQSYLASLSKDIEIFEQLKTDHPICLELTNFRYKK